MRDLVSSCSVGKIDGKIVVDVGGIEDNYGEVDLALAVVGKQDKFVLLQMDGIVTRKEFLEMIELGKKTCHVIHDEQKKTLKQKYSNGGNND